MSRWIEVFENHAFQDIWKNIQDIKEEVVVDDETVTTSVEEIARLNKVIIFVNALLESCDPELIPASTWDSFYSQSNACLQQINSYQSNRNIGHICNANSHLDNLLTYIRPYQVVAGKAAQSASASFVAYTKTINKNLNSFQEEANKVLAKINSFKDSALSHREETEVARDKIKELELSYFDDSEQESLSSRIEQLESTL